MSAEVETMFSVRETPWHGLGTIVQDAPTSADALKLAGLDWSVESRPVFDEDGNEVDGYKRNVRNTDNSTLGIVSDKYKIVQNAEAFAFTDSLLGEGVKYESAGSLYNGKQVWLLAKMETTKILNDEIEPYMCFTNMHNGQGSVRVVMTPVRVVCSNTLNFALKSASRAWSTRHLGDLSSKIADAEYTLELSAKYMENLAITAEQLANTSVNDAQLTQYLDTMFPIEDKDKDSRPFKIAQKHRDDFIVCYMAPDIQKFKGTAWGVINAASDYSTHVAPIRQTEQAKLNRFGSLLNGNVFVDTSLMQLIALTAMKTR